MGSPPLAGGAPFGAELEVTVPVDDVDEFEDVDEAELVRWRGLRGKNIVLLAMSSGFAGLH